MQEKEQGTRIEKHATNVARNYPRKYASKVARN